LNSGDCPEPLIFNFSLEYVIRKFQANKEGLKLNGAYQVLICVNNANVLGGTYITRRKPQKL
jgi:hypothetical protein